MRNKLALTAALAASALLAGCSSGATESPEQSPPSGVNMHGAPKVQKPLDTKAFQQQPCSVLKPEQISALSMQQWESEVDMDSTGGPKCGWQYMGGPPDYTVSSVGVTFMVESDGLKSSYFRKGKGVFEYFRQLKPIGGYPAIAAGSSVSTPEQEGTCEVEVGVTDSLTFLTQVQLGNGSPFAGDPCGRARDVATEVVKTLKAGA